MTDRFSNMSKLPDEPAARMLATANAKLETEIDAPANAPAEVLLTELQEKGALIDTIRLLSVLLPARERVWWSCLAARDIIGDDEKMITPPLAASEAWVFKPSEENRETARASLEHAGIDDDSVLCATSVLYADGTLGPGDLAEYPAPAGASEVTAFAMNIVALKAHSDRMEEYGQMLIDRAVDIARGGNGQVEAGASKPDDVEKDK
ncbi:MAG: DUF6931 family protein [Paracoccaceae bacterium]